MCQNDGLKTENNSTRTKMLGRVWWGLVWTVCMITVVSSSPCREGVEYYNSGEGRCVPCTRCEGHLVVVIKCYVYQDAVCAPVLAVIAGGPLPSEHSLEEEKVEMEEENHSRSVVQHRKVSFDPHNVSHFQNFSALRSTREKDSFKDPDVEGEREIHHKDRKGRRRPKEEKGSRPFRHRHPSHRKVQSHRQAISGSGDMVTHSNDSYTSGAIDMSIVSLSDVWRGPEDPSDGVERTGASSAKNPEGLEEEEIMEVEEEEEEKENEQRQGWDWQTIMYLTAALLVVLSVILLINAALCHLRNYYNKKRLTRQEGEVQVVTQLLPCEPHALPRETQVVQSHQQQQQQQHLQQQRQQQQLQHNQQQSPLPVHQHPDAAYTMDRLLERRRVTESLESNLYVDSCRRGSQANVLQLFPSTPLLSQIGGSVVGGSVSASTTPRVRRVYRARAPVSASASPVISPRSASLWNSVLTGAGRQQGGGPVGQRGGQGSSWLTHSTNPAAVSVNSNHQHSHGQPL